MKTTPCVLRLLSSSKHCSLWECTDCRIKHLQVMNTTIRISHEQAIEIANTFNKAIFNGDTTNLNSCLDRNMAFN